MKNEKDISAKEVIEVGEKLGFSDKVRQLLVLTALPEAYGWSSDPEFVEKGLEGLSFSKKELIEHLKKHANGDYERWYLNKIIVCVTGSTLFEEPTNGYGQSYWSSYEANYLRERSGLPFKNL